MNRKLNTYKNAVNFGLDQYMPKVGDSLGLSWTNSGSKYKAIVRVVKVNASSLRVRLTETKPSNYNEGQEWAVNHLKPTRDNHLFYLTAPNNSISIDDIKEYNRNEAELEKLVRDKINEYWTEKIEKMEAKQKEEGVYESGDLHVIDETGFHKVTNLKEISQ